MEIESLFISISLFLIPVVVIAFAGTKMARRWIFSNVFPKLGLPCFDVLIVVFS